MGRVDCLQAPGLAKNYNLVLHKFSDGSSFKIKLLFVACRLSMKDLFTEPLESLRGEHIWACWFTAFHLFVHVSLAISNERTFVVNTLCVLMCYTFSISTQLIRVWPLPEMILQLAELYLDATNLLILSLESLHFDLHINSLSLSL